MNPEDSGCEHDPGSGSSDESDDGAIEVEEYAPGRFCRAPPRKRHAEPSGPVLGPHFLPSRRERGLPKRPRRRRQWQRERQRLEWQQLDREWQRRRQEQERQSPPQQQEQVPVRCRRRRRRRVEPARPSDEVVAVAVAAAVSAVRQADRDDGSLAGGASTSGVVRPRSRKLRPLCYNCRRPGHVRAECPDFDNRVCHHCKELGHIFEFCPKKAQARPTEEEERELRRAAAVQLARRIRSGLASEFDVKAALTESGTKRKRRR